LLRCEAFAPPQLVRSTSNPTPSPTSSAEPKTFKRKESLNEIFLFLFNKKSFDFVLFCIAITYYKTLNLNMASLHLMHQLAL